MTRAFMYQVDEVKHNLAITAKNIEVLVDQESPLLGFGAGCDGGRFREHADRVLHDTQVIESEVVRMIASQDAYSDDIQSLCALLKVSRALGRVGRTAARLVERVRVLDEQAWPRFAARLSPILMRITSVVHQVIHAFGDHGGFSGSDPLKRMEALEEEANGVVQGLMRDLRIESLPPNACFEFFFVVDDVQRMLEQSRAVALALAGRAATTLLPNRAACFVG